MRRNTICGTYEYMAPEILFHKQQSTGIDIWALGILLYELIHNRAPYSGRSMNEVKKRIINSKIRFKSNCNPDAKDLIQKILRVKSKDRPTIEQILKHPFVTKNFYGRIPSKDDNCAKVAANTSSNNLTSNAVSTRTTATSTPKLISKPLSFMETTKVASSNNTNMPTASNGTLNTVSSQRTLTLNKNSSNSKITPMNTIHFKTTNNVFASSSRKNIIQEPVSQQAVTPLSRINSASSSVNKSYSITKKYTSDNNMK